MSLATPLPEGPMRFTCEHSCVEDTRVLKRYMGNAGHVILWPDNTMTLTTRRLSRQQLDAIAICLEMLGLEIQCKPTTDGEAELLEG